MVSQFTSKVLSEGNNFFTRYIHTKHKPGYKTSGFAFHIPINPDALGIFLSILLLDSPIIIGYRTDIIQISSAVAAVVCLSTALSPQHSLDF